MEMEMEMERDIFENEMKEIASAIQQSMGRVKAIQDFEEQVLVLHREIDKLISRFGAREMVMLGFFLTATAEDRTLRAVHGFDNEGEQK